MPGRCDWTLSKQLLLLTLKAIYSYGPYRRNYHKLFGASSQQQQFTAAEDHEVGECLRLAELAPESTQYLIHYYKIFSSIVNVYVLLQELVAYMAAPSELKSGAKQWICLMPGRVNLSYWGNTSVISKLLALFNLSWRIRKWTRSDPNHRLDLISFLIQDPRLVGIYNHRRQHSYRPTQDNNVTSLFYYQVSNYDQRKLRIRHNRTEAAYTKLVRLTIPLFLTIYGLTFILFSIFMQPLTIFDGYYAEYYQHCDPEMALILRERKLNKWSITWTKYKIVALPMDLVENFVVWLDFWTGLAANLALMALIDYDLMVYARFVRDRLNKLIQRLSIYHLLQQQLDLATHANLSTGPLKDANSDSDHKIELKMNLRHRRVPTRIRGSKISAVLIYSHEMCIDGIADKLHLNNHHLGAIERRNWTELEYGIRDIQFVLVDLFKQIRLGDIYASEFITIGITYWFIALASITVTNLASGDYSALAAAKVKDGGGLILMRLLQSASFLVFMVVGWYMVRLSREMFSIHKLVCNLMALDRSRYKLRFSHILSHYSKDKMPCYTILHRHPLVPSSVLVVASWAISIILVTENLFKNGPISRFFN